MKTVSLHHHTTFSYMDGVKTPEDHAARSAELGMPAQAVTEHGNVSSHAGHEKACRKVGIKPLFGLEAYTHSEPDSARKFHLTLLAMDETGYRNLMHLVTRSWAEGFYRWPTVSGEMLADHHEGIICLSGCSDSLLACSLLGGKTIDESDSSFKRAQRVATNFRALFGDRYYLECQAFPELQRTQAINSAYERLSEITGIPLVGTFDVHYPHPEDNELQVLVHAAGRGNNTVAQQLETWEYEIRLTHPQSDAESLARLRGTGLGKKAAGRALANTAEIADRCNVILPKAERLRFPLPPGKDTAVDLIWQWLREGWKYRVQQGNGRMRKLREEYKARVNLEMKLIVEKDFVDYFLMLSEIVRWAKDAGEPVGPARGSAAASLVCYLLRITEIDPLQYPLMYFDRFIAPDREDVPDIDLDFDDDMRANTRARVVERYGEDRVANIATFTQYKGKNSIDDVARVHSIPRGEAEKVKSMVVERSTGDARASATLQDTFDMFPEAADVLARYPKLALATRLEGSYRGMSTHAAGLVVTNGPISDYCAIYTRENAAGEKTTAVSVDKYNAEYLGLMKADFLGLSTMGMIRIALEHAGLTLEELYRVPMDEPETMEAFRRTDVIGIFQFEGRATRLITREVRPDNFLELADINALSRPGPLFSGTTTEYIKTKRGEMPEQRFHPVVDAFTTATKGQIIYQEQVLGVLREFGGLPVARVHDIRKIISQKLGHAQFNKSEADFAVGAARLHGVDEELAKRVWARLVTSATYSFNIAHCVSYSMLAFWCMWLKVHYPTAFYKAQLIKTDKEKWPRLIQDAENHDHRVHGVTLGVSGIGWSAPEDRLIYAGYEQLNGVGPVTAQKIVDYDTAKKRADGMGLRSAEDLLGVNGIGPKTLEKFRPQINNEDPFGLRTRRTNLERVRAFIAETPGLPAPNFTSDSLLHASNAAVIWVGIPIERNYQDVVENERTRYGRPVAEIKAKMKRPDLTNSVVLRCVDDGEEDVYVRISRWNYPKMKKAIDGLRVGLDVVLVVGHKTDKVAAFGISVHTNHIIVIAPDED